LSRFTTTTGEYNLGVLYVDSTSIGLIGVIDGNPAIPI
jgi:hypothetical protein